jgi:hypothetical protein
MFFQECIDGAHASRPLVSLHLIQSVEKRQQSVVIQPGAPDALGDKVLRPQLFREPSEERLGLLLP